MALRFASQSAQPATFALILYPLLYAQLVSTVESARPPAVRAQTAISRPQGLQLALSCARQAPFASMAQPLLARQARFPLLGRLHVAHAQTAISRQQGLQLAL